MKDRSKIFISVIGGGDCSPEARRVAEEVGREIARRGAVLVCGGLGGVMEAACKGASAEGGLTVGILPGDNRATANPYVAIPIVTGIGPARNVAVVRSGQAVIAVDGSYGTMSEIGHALQSGIPVIGLSTWSARLPGQEAAPVIPAESARDAVDRAMAMIRSRYPV